MRVRALRFFARRPLALVALGVASVIGVGAAAALAVGASRGGECDSGARGDAVAPESKDPKLILGRGWFDSYPQKRTDVLKLYFFGGGGVGIYEEGSAYRYAVDVFELERQNDKLNIKFFQDGKTAETKFTITACDEKPPFDLCLDIPGAPRGPKRYYGFDDYDDEVAAIPWAGELMRREVQELGESRGAR